MKKYYLLLIVIFQILTLIIFAQSNKSQSSSPLNGSSFNASYNELQPTWVRHYFTNEAPSRNSYNAIVIDQEGNVYLGGSAEESFPRRSIMMLTKLNSQGVEQWLILDTSITAIVKLSLDSTGSLIALGSNGIMKYSPDGIMMWKLKDENLQWSEITHVDSLGNVFGKCYDTSIETDVILKINKDGLEQWRINISGLIIFDRESNCYSTNSEETIDHNASEIVTRKYDSFGILQWTSHYKRSNSNGPIGIELNGSDIIIIGITSGTPGENYNLEALRYGSDGTLKLNFSIGTYPWYPKWTIDDDGSIYMWFAWTYMYPQYTLYKYGANGLLQWSRFGAAYTEGPIVIDSEGNIVVCYMESYGGFFGVTKYNKNGDLLWKTRTIARASYYKVPRGLLIGEDGKIYLLGEIEDNGSYHIIQFSSEGAINWDITRTPPQDYKVDYAGNFYCIGENWQNNAVLEKYSSKGGKEWVNSYEGNKIPQDCPAGMEIDSIGNVYILSDKRFKDRIGFAIIKYNSQGDSLWVREGACTNTPHMAISTEGSAYITREIRFYDSVGVHITQFVEKFSNEGNIEWSVEYHPLTNTELSTQSIMYHESGYVTVISDKSEPEKPSGILIQNFNPTGTLNWAIESYPEQLNSSRSFGAATLDKSGDLLMTVRDANAQDQKTFYTLKLNKSGQQLWSNPLQTGDTLFSYSAITSTEEGSVFVAGAGEINGIPTGLIAIKFDENGNQQWLARETTYLSVSAIETDYKGNLFILGTGSDSLGSNCLIAAYDSLGNKLWRQDHQHLSHIILPPKMSIDKNGNIYKLCGDEDLITTCYASDGTKVWTSSFAEQDWSVEHYPGALCLDGKGQLFVSGGSGTWINSWWGKGGGTYLDAGILVTLRYDLISTSISVNDPSLPDHFALYQNYPNPFNSITKIFYALSSQQHVTLKVYDILGNEIQTLVNEEKPIGTYEVTWHAANLPSGVYFHQLKAGNFIDTKKMILLK